MLKPQIINYRWLCLLLQVLIISSLLTVCGPTTAPTAEVVVQPPVPTPTLEPTFTPSASPTDTLPPLPTATTEPTPTPPPQANLLGRILDQETGQSIGGAKVSAGAETATTDTDGHYSLTGLAPGQYILSATHDGYDPALSAIFTLSAGQELEVDLTLYAPDTSPYPQDPMLTNPLDPNGAHTKEDAERLAREQGLTGEVVSIEETILTSEYLVNYKIGDEIRAAVAELNHDVWELMDEAGRKWWIIKVCGNLASPLPAQKPIPTPKPILLPPMAEVGVDELIVRACTSDECAEVGTVPRGERVEVFGCLADKSWCEVSWSGGRGWCTGQSLRQLAVTKVIPSATPVLPTPTPTPEAVTSGGGKIAFVSDRDGNDEIYVINPDGSGLTRLTNHPARDWDPSWSPDGQRLAFVSTRDGPDPQNCDRIGKPHCNWEIYVMNPDGTGSTRLTNLLGTPVTLGTPTWSPDSSRIAFSFSPGGLINIYVMNVDGSGQTQLTNDLHGASLDPSWSPGRQIVFYSLRDDGNQEIYVMNGDGSGQTRLTYDSASDITPTWSPDGDRIAFVSGSQPRVDADWGIYVMNADGSGRTRLTDGSLGSIPTWSPDGTRIAFGRDGNIYVMNVDGSDLRRLTEGSSPAWSR